MAEDSYSTAAGEALVADGIGGNPAGLLANDSIPGGVATNFKIVREPRFGQLVANEDGTFDYLPDASFEGTDSFAYSIDDPNPVALVGTDTFWRYFQPTDGLPPDFADPDFDQTWMTAGFDDSGWLDGWGVIGYGTLGTGNTILGISTGVSPPAENQRFGLYLRVDVDVPAAGVYRLQGRLFRDDAAIFYIGGSEIARSYQPDSILLRAERDDYFLFVGNDWSAFTIYEEEVVEHELSIEGVQLEPGSNTLAVSLRNSTGSAGVLTSSDIGFYLPELTATKVSTAEVEVFVGERELAMPQLDWYSTSTGGQLNTKSAGLPGLLSNDHLSNALGEPLVGPLSIVLDTAVLQGSIVAMPGELGHFVYTPPADFAGLTEFGYRVMSADGLSGSVRVLIFVGGPGDVRPVPLALGSGASEVFPVGLPESSQPSLVSAPSNGTVTLELPVQGAAQLVYEADAGFSGADRFELSIAEASPLLDNAVWTYFDTEGDIDPGIADPDFDTTWHLPEFDDTNWQEGLGPFGYGGAGGVEFQTILPRGGRTTYLRHQFELAELSSDRYILPMVVDDAVVVYLNGVEIGRVPSGLQGEDDYNLVVANRGGSAESEVVDVPVPFEVLRLGTNTLAVSLHNSTTFSSDLAFAPGRLISRVRLPVEVEVSSPLRGWIEANFAGFPGDDGEVAELLADPDGDGLQNIVEYFYQTDPFVADVAADVLAIEVSGVVPSLAVPEIRVSDVMVEVERASDMMSGTWNKVGVLYGGEPWVSLKGTELAGASFGVDPNAATFYRFRFMPMEWVTDVPRPGVAE